MVNRKKIGKNCFILSLALLLTQFACTKKQKYFGVDPGKKVLTIGYLNDISGPAAAIGVPYAEGKRILVKQINAGDSGLLPEGWKIKMIERDHSYNPQKSVTLFKQIKDRVLFIGTSFGTPNTLPLRPLLERENIVAFPASLSSAMARHKYTPPIGVSYQREAALGVQWAIEDAGGSKKIKAGIIYQNDDYGRDALIAWKKALKRKGIKNGVEQSIAPGQRDFIAVISVLKDSGVTHVHLAVLPSATGTILGNAMKSEYKPIWIANTPVWIDNFFDSNVIPSVIFAKYYQLSGMPFWGENVPGMKAFLKVHKKFSKASPNFYSLVSYIQGLVQIQAFNKALQRGDFSRTGYLKALQSMAKVDLGGMIQSLDFTSIPYVTGTRVRILKPDFKKKSWKIIKNYSEPESL